jgi:chorismate lyase / 3-hydroxybenzoate synthase
MKLRFDNSCSPDHLALGQVLGGFELGSSLAQVFGPSPVQRLFMPVLQGEDAIVREAWLVDRPVAQGNTEGIAWRRSGDLLFGVITLSEHSADPGEEAPTLRRLSEQAYLRLFRLLDAQGLPHLWRVWNYMPDIHGEQHGLERYRQFNLGRGDAFEHCARSVTEQVPAACALGMSEGPLSVAFMCSATPLVPIENPRQVSAYRYPSHYGPRSPTFSRAALAYLDAQELFFVSGTASIVGHESLHEGDVAAQTRETLDNIAAVLDEAAECSPAGRFAPCDLAYRAYVRHAADVDAVRREVVARLGPSPVQYVQADVCRRELLMEIEALGLRDL